LVLDGFLWSVKGLSQVDPHLTAFDQQRQADLFRISFIEGSVVFQHCDMAPF